MKWVMRVLRWLFDSEPISEDIRDAQRAAGKDRLHQ